MNDRFFIIYTHFSGALLLVLYNKRNRTCINQRPQIFFHFFIWWESCCFKPFLRDPKNVWLKMTWSDYKDGDQVIYSVFYVVVTPLVRDIVSSSDDTYSDRNITFQIQMSCITNVQVFCSKLYYAAFHARQSWSSLAHRIWSNFKTLFQRTL